MGVSVAQHSAMTNDENEYTLLLPEHKVNQTFWIQYKSFSAFTVWCFKGYLTGQCSLACLCVYEGLYSFNWFVTMQIEQMFSCIDLMSSSKFNHYDICN